jgi:hypothetical protein
MSTEDVFEEDEHGKRKPGALSDKTKGIIVGAAGALALAGILYAIMREETPKKAVHKTVPSDLPLDQDMFAEPPLEEAEVEVTETPTADDGIKITSVLKDVSTVGMAARGIAALEPVADMLIALL